MGAGGRDGSGADGLAAPRLAATASPREPLVQHHTPRRLLLTAALSLAVLAAGPTAAQACPPGAGPGAAERAAHRLTVTVTGTGGAGDGTYTLKCAPNGGTHSSPDAACERLDQLAAAGTNPFRPVTRGAMCTQQYGGPETARVKGRWQGQPVDATFSRTDGCQISRWNSLVPVLPATGA